MKKKVLLCILMIGALAGSATSLNFKRVAYIPLGLVWSKGYIKGADINHDGLEDLAFSTVMFPGDSTRIVFYGYRPFNKYDFEDSIQNPSLFWDLGDLDGDSLMDLVAQRGDRLPSGIRIFEPNNYWSFPKNLIWFWPWEYIGNGVQPMYIADLDQDGQKEILTADAQVVYVFENRGDNQYVKVYSDTIPQVPSGRFAVGDFDGDGLMEFACGSQGWTVYVYECIGPDQYRMSWSGPLDTPNMFDVITMPDIDGDGKPEFLIGALRTGPSPWSAQMYIYESTGNDQYSVIYGDSIPIWDRGVYAVHSDCGDVDRDGSPELVWAIDRDWMVYKSNGNNQFQRVFSAYGDNGHNSTNIHIHDMNGNGYPEIIESGGNETHIWEVEPCRLVYPNGGETLYWDSLAVIRWRNVTPFVADSFSLFFSTDSSRTYSLIAHGIPGSDSSYVWTVPDTLSDTCFIMIWAYQNAVGWDFSDQAFHIRRPDGVEAKEVFSSPVSHLPYRVAPNPFISCAAVPGHEKESFALYDVSGRRVGIYKGDRIGVGLSAGIYFLKPEGKDAKPLRLVKLR